VENFFGDYKEFSGVMMPTSLETRMNDQVGATIQFEAVEINVEVDDSIFKLPKKEK
jgi:outer membrane lipoprotein-sorting protein